MIIRCQFMVVHVIVSLLMLWKLPVFSAVTEVSKGMFLVVLFICNTYVVRLNMAEKSIPYVFFFLLVLNKYLLKSLNITLAHYLVGASVIHWQLILSLGDIICCNFYIEVCIYIIAIVSSPLNSLGKGWSVIGVNGAYALSL